MFCSWSDFFGRLRSVYLDRATPCWSVQCCQVKVLQGAPIQWRICISRKRSLIPGLGALALAEEHNKEEGHHKGLQPCFKASENISGLVFLPAVYFSWNAGQAHPVRASEWLGKLKHKFTNSCSVPSLVVRSAPMASATNLQLQRETHWQPFPCSLPCLCHLLTPSWSSPLSACVGNTTCYSTAVPGPQCFRQLLPKHLISCPWQALPGN